MSNMFIDKIFTKFPALCALSAAIASIGFTGLATGATVNGMYDAAVRITDNTEASKQAAFATALGIVASRVTGQRDAATKLGATLNSASKYVQRFGYNSGFLEVGFDSAGVNLMLESAGLPLWGRERPATLVVMPGALQGVREARAAVEQTAKSRGVPLIWAKGEVSEKLSATNVAQYQPLADSYGASAVLVARMIDPTSITTIRWQLIFDGSVQEIQGAIDEGPHLAADVLGRSYAVAEKDTVMTTLDIAGIDGLDAYATTMNYMTGLSMVRSVKVDSVDKDHLRLNVEVRGKIESLRRGLELDQKLITQQSAEDVASGMTLVYRLNGTRP